MEVGASYAAPPSAVKAACSSDGPVVPRADAPSPDVMLMSFDSSSVTYRGALDRDYERTKRRGISANIDYYVFRRRGIEIPFPIQVQYESPPPAVDPPWAGRRGRRSPVSISSRP